MDRLERELIDTLSGYAESGKSPCHLLSYHMVAERYVSSEEGKRRLQDIEDRVESITENPRFEERVREELPELTDRYEYLLSVDWETVEELGRPQLTVIRSVIQRGLEWLEDTERGIPSETRDRIAELDEELREQVSAEPDKFRSVFKDMVPDRDWWYRPVREASESD